MIMNYQLTGNCVFKAAYKCLTEERGVSKLYYGNLVGYSNAILERYADLVVVTRLDC